MHVVDGEQAVELPPGNLVTTVSRAPLSRER